MSEGFRVKYAIRELRHMAIVFWAVLRSSFLIRGFTAKKAQPDDDYIYATKHTCHRLGSGSDLVDVSLS